jgi:hypothetical protein
MYWIRCHQPARYFSTPNSLILDSLPAHNEELAGDELSSIVLNYRWRSIIVQALEFYYRSSDGSDLALDNDDLLNNLIGDIYDFEANVTIATHVLSVDLSTNKTTTSLSFVAITGSSVSFTPSKANFRVVAHNLLLVNSANIDTIAEVRFNGVAGSENAQAQQFGVTRETHAAGSVFEGVSVGVAHNIELYWKVALASTGTIVANENILYEIVEYD